MKEKVEKQMSPKDNPKDNMSDTKDANFGNMLHMLRDDTIEHVCAQLRVCLKNLENKEKRQYSDVAAHTLDILQSSLKSLELLQQLQQVALDLRNLIQKKP